MRAVRLQFEFTDAIDGRIEWPKVGVCHIRRTGSRAPHGFVGLIDEDGTDAFDKIRFCTRCSDAHCSTILSTQTFRQRATTCALTQRVERDLHTVHPRAEKQRCNTKHTHTE